MIKSEISSHEPHQKNVITIRERKLGKHRAYGLYWPAIETIELDSRLRGKHAAYVACHEATHAAADYLTEEEVIRVSRVISNVMWAIGYRRKR